MKQAALYIMVLSNCMIFFPTVTVVFDHDYVEIIGLSWIAIGPIIKLSMICSIINIIACIVIGYFIDEENVRRGGENEKPLA